MTLEEPREALFSSALGLGNYVPVASAGESVWPVYPILMATATAFAKSLSA